MIGHGRAQPPALPHYLSGRMRGCNGPYWAPTWWDKAVGFRNKEGDKFPTLPPIGTTCSNRVLVSMCATSLASSTPPTSRFFRSTTQQTHNPYWRRIEANIGCEELFSEQHRSATHQRNASKAEKDGLHLAGVRLLISRSFLSEEERVNTSQQLFKDRDQGFQLLTIGPLLNAQKGLGINP